MCSGAGGQGSGTFSGCFSLTGVTLLKSLPLSGLVGWEQG